MEEDVVGDELNNMDLHIILFGLAKVSFSFGLLIPKNHHRTLGPYRSEFFRNGFPAKDRWQNLLCFKS